MTTTPNEPLEDPDITPSGDPDSSPEPVGPGAEPAEDPEVNPVPGSEPPDIVG